jgi:hypothetical protein
MKFSNSKCLHKVKFDSIRGKKKFSIQIKMSNDKSSQKSKPEKENLEVEETKKIDDEVEKTEENTKLHPLERSWTLWYDCPVKKYNQTNYELNKVYTFNTVEDFWRYFLFF